MSLEKLIEGLLYRYRIQVRGRVSIEDGLILGDSTIVYASSRAEVIEKAHMFGLERFEIEPVSLEDVYIYYTNARQRE